MLFQKAVLVTANITSLHSLLKFCVSARSYMIIFLLLFDEQSKSPLNF